MSPRSVTWRRLLVTVALTATVAACSGQDRATERSRSAVVPPLHPSVDDYPDAVVRLVAPDGSDTARVAVKVADTPERRRHGLMQVAHLPDGVGMLFAFPHDTQGPFWMKGTRIPLDIAFVAANGDVREILHMQPCRTDPCELYPPSVVYRRALEVPGGWFERVGVTEGWRLEVPDTPQPT